MMRTIQDPGAAKNRKVPSSDTTSSPVNSPGAIQQTGIGPARAYHDTLDDRLGRQIHPRRNRDAPLRCGAILSRPQRASPGSRGPPAGEPHPVHEPPYSFAPVWPMTSCGATGCGRSARRCGSGRWRPCRSRNARRCGVSGARRRPGAGMRQSCSHRSGDLTSWAPELTKEVRVVHFSYGMREICQQGGRTTPRNDPYRRGHPGRRSHPIPLGTSRPDGHTRCPSRPAARRATPEQPECASPGGHLTHTGTQSLQKVRGLRRVVGSHRSMGGEVR